MRKYLYILVLSLAMSLQAAATNMLSDSARIYLLTCTPGTQVWSKYGHTGIRVADPVGDIDIVFNYGIFDLTANDFYLKFIHGETYYQLGIESYKYFERYYSYFGRITYWQELNLTQVQKQQIFDALLVNYQPENRFYHYNFVFDNCATRPYYLLKEALQDTILSSYQGYCGSTFREAITHYTGHNSWVDFGINLVFGCEADEAMTNEQRLFLPEELMYYMAQARLSDGTALVKAQHIEGFTPAPVKWYNNCWLGIALFTLLMVAQSLWDRKRGKCAWGVDVALGVVYLIMALLVIYLSFFSCHPLVGFNWRIILLPIIHVCTRLIYIYR